MQVVERHIIDRFKPMWSEIDREAFLSKNLWNSCNYIWRQHFFKIRQILKWETVYHQVKNTKDYQALPTKVSKQILRRVGQAWSGYKQAHQEWKLDPNKFKAEPRIPKYKHKTKGRNILPFPSDTISKKELANGQIKLCPKSLSWQLPNLRNFRDREEIAEIRFVPKSGCYIMEVVYELEPENQANGDGIAGIDVGIDNLMAVASNQLGIRPLLINGRPLKAINAYFNKRRAKLQSELEKKHKQKQSRRLDELNKKRNNRVENYLHNSSRYLISWCLRNGIKTLVIGKNNNWKQGINIGKRNTQQFMAIPHARLIEMIKYKAKLVGIEVRETEESYTSKASALDDDPLPTYGDENIPKFSGIRKPRGLYRTAKGHKISSDINGAWNIIRKVIPNAIAEGIKVLPLMPEVVNPLKQPMYSFV